ncbi:MAG: hypothetical protein OQK73_08585 [Gammaproteobacteria bacterium]|nr:hypothetical protein [Gammaproteobacteria bacterium]
MKFSRRALNLATRGILAGTAIGLATHGLIQIPIVDVPVQVVTQPAAGAVS